MKFLDISVYIKPDEGSVQFEFVRNKTDNDFVAFEHLMRDVDGNYIRLLTEHEKLELLKKLTKSIKG